MNDHPPDTIARAQAGEEEAFRMLVEQHSRSVFNVAYRIVGNPHDAEEAVQETFLRVFKRLDGFQERAQFTTWLYRVAANAALDLVRKRQRHASRETELEIQDAPSRPHAVTTPDPERMARSGQISERVAGAMDLLTPGERAAFTLRHLQGLSIHEIGTALDMEGSAVKNAIFRAVQKMRHELAPLASEMS
jgi:RNA polymerase sigma-70 factor (ECF subfamily)